MSPALKNDPAPPPAPAFLAASCVFVSALLLFWLQPMMGRIMLPHFGGVASVWIVCLLIYQLLLFLGYAYAHWIGNVPTQRQINIHAMLLSGALIWLAFRSFRLALPLDIPVILTDRAPQEQAGIALFLTVGLPYLCLAATSTRVQAWLAATQQNNRVYHLYGISNAGAFVGLFLYPFVLEMHLSLKGQQILWLSGFVFFVVLLALLWRRLDLSVDSGNAGPRHEGNAMPPPPAFRSDPALWIGLPMTGSFLLVSGTSHLTLDITPLPALWAIVLGAYLLSFVIGFSRGGERLLPLWCIFALALCLAQALVTYYLPRVPHIWMIGSGLATVFFGALFLHAWLHALRPPASLLSRYYLYVAGGGGMGGILGSLVAPWLFPSVWEYPVAIVMVSLLVWGYLHRHKPPQIASVRPVALCAIPAILLWSGLAIHHEFRNSLALRRGFYGRIVVQEEPIQTAGQEAGIMRRMLHGNTLHGVERRVGNRRLPAASYYADIAGGPVALTQHPRRNDPGFRVGMIGLGVGEMLDFALPTDQWHIYEISPEVIELASNPEFFSFVTECPADLTIIAGDARKRMEQERLQAHPARFDFLIVDAYSGDAVPLHLLTREAFALFLDRLADDGILALHLTNWHMDLLPLIKTHARTFGLEARAVFSRDDPSRSRLAAIWAILSRTPVELELSTDARWVDWNPIVAGPPLTDHHGSVLRYLRFRWKSVPTIRPESPSAIPTFQLDR